jgi:hypothetical protein
VATKKKNKNKNKADSESNKIEEIGIRELMLFNCEINSNELLTMNHDELKSLIDSKLSEESFLVYRLDEWNGLDEGILNQSENTNLFLDEKLFKHSGDEKINCKVIYNEKNQLPELNENQVRLVFWEELNESSASIDIAENIDNINLVINGNTFGCMDDWGYETFTEYSFTSAGKELDIYLSSESYGGQKEKVVYLINSNGDCGSIRDLDYNDNFADEVIEAFEGLGLK